MAKIITAAATAIPREGALTWPTPVVVTLGEDEEVELRVAEVEAEAEVGAELTVLDSSAKAPPRSRVTGEPKALHWVS